MTTINKTKPDTIVASHNGFILSIVITLIIGLAAGAFVLSFDALHALALASAISPMIAWIWPLIIDGFIITATIAVFSLRGRETRTTWYPWAALILFAFISVFGNSIHAVNNQDILGVDVWIAASVSAAPAIALLMASHFLVIMISAPRHTVEKETIVTDSAGHETGRVVVPQPFTEPVIKHVQPEDSPPEDELKKELSPEKEITGQGSNENITAEPLAEESLAVPEALPVAEEVSHSVPVEDEKAPSEPKTVVSESITESFGEEKPSEPDVTIAPEPEDETEQEEAVSVAPEVVIPEASPITEEKPEKNTNVFIIQEKTETSAFVLPEEPPVVIQEAKTDITQTLLMRFILDNPDFIDADIMEKFNVDEAELPKRVKALKKKYGETFENHPTRLKA